MLDLDALCRDWRVRLKRETSLSAGERDELADHLVASVECECASDPSLTPAEAFAIAETELGDSAILDQEFKKVRARGRLWLTVSAACAALLVTGIPFYWWVALTVGVPSMLSGAWDVAFLRENMVLVDRQAKHVFVVDKPGGFGLPRLRLGERRVYAALGTEGTFQCFSKLASQTTLCLHVDTAFDYKDYGSDAILKLSVQSVPILRPPTPPGEAFGGEWGDPASMASSLGWMPLVP